MKSYLIYSLIIATSVFLVTCKAPQHKRSGEGPVVFPSSSDSDRASTINNSISIISNNLQNNEHPYSKISRRLKSTTDPSRIYKDDRRNIQVLKALAKQGAKVLPVPPENLGRDHVPLSYKTRRRQQQRKSYAFSYKVVDRSTGDDFSHTQVRNVGVTEGEYRVRLPDGRVQVVSYTADKGGYKADVKYQQADEHNENNDGQTPAEIPYRDNRNIVQKKPVHQLQTLVIKDNPHRSSHVKLISTKSLISTTEPGHFGGDYESVILSPGPEFLNTQRHENKYIQAPSPLNVQIFTTNARDYSFGYIPVEITPAYYNDNGHYRSSDLLSAQINTNGDHGLVIPSTASSFVLADQHGQVIDNIKLVTSTAVPYLQVTTSGLPLVHGSAIA